MSVGPVIIRENINMLIFYVIIVSYISVIVIKINISWITFAPKNQTELLRLIGHIFQKKKHELSVTKVVEL